jgi:hypothetical protein
VARINIEDCWWSDPRRTALLLTVGFEADSAAVNMWRAAQEFWGKGRGLVPAEVFFKLKHAQALIDSGLADVRDRSVYVRGSSSYLDWHFEKREQARAAGKRSAEVRRESNGTAQPHGGKGHRKSERQPNEIRTESNGTEPSDSDSDSDSLSGLGSRSRKKNNAQPDGFATFWEGYPNKKGKSRAMKLYAKALAEGASPAELILARDRYIADLKVNQTEKRFIQQGPRFMGEWHDWLDPETGQAEDFSDKPENILDLKLPDYGGVS